MEVHLLSTPGEDGKFVYDEIKRISSEMKFPKVLYIPIDGKQNRYLEFTKELLGRLVNLQLIDLTDPAFKEVCEETIFYVPGGNTFNLAILLKESGYDQVIRRGILSGLPYIGFSAGAVVLGSSLSSSNNELKESTDPLGILPFSINPHYPSEENKRRERIELLSTRFRNDDSPVIALEDDSHVLWDGSSVEVRRNKVWLLKRSKHNQSLEPTLLADSFAPDGFGGRAARGADQF
jgi:peptidase E